MINNKNNRLINGTLLRTSIMGKNKAGDMLVSVNIKRLKKGLFHTAYGKVEASFNVSCIQVDSKHGCREYIAGNFPEARALARRIMKENIDFEDVGTFIELEINYETLNSLVENAFIYQTKTISLSPKDIEENVKSLL